MAEFSDPGRQSQGSQGDVASLRQKPVAMEDNRTRQRKAVLLDDNRAQAQRGRVLQDTRGAPASLNPVAQRVARTQQVAMHSAGTPPRMVVANAAGQPPSNQSVGVTMALGTNGWGGVAIAPTAEYCRAHALAEVLGGSGDNTNVGWWTQKNEGKWGEFEAQAQGRAGANFDRDFQPGVSETGNYKVVSNSAQLNVQPNFVAGITATVNALNNATINPVGVALASGVFTQHGVDWATPQAAALAAFHDQATNRIGPWLTTVFSPTAGGPWVWTSMVGSYKRTGARGGGNGSKRSKEFGHTEVPTPLQAADFGLVPGSEAQLWDLMRNANEGVFTQGNNPLRNLSKDEPVFDANDKTGDFRFRIGDFSHINVDFRD